MDDGNIETNEVWHNRRNEDKAIVNTGHCFCCVDTYHLISGDTESFDCLCLVGTNEPYTVILLNVVAEWLALLLRIW